MTAVRDKAEVKSLYTYNSKFKVREQRSSPQSVSGIFPCHVSFRPLIAAVHSRGVWRCRRNPAGDFTPVHPYTLETHPAPKP
jgi:hypothetical protein